MTAADRATLDAYEQTVVEIPNVLVAHDLPNFQQLYDDHLATLPGVHRLSSTLVMKTVSENRPLPLG